MWVALKLVWEMGYVIAIPLVIFGLTGRLFDKKLHTAPLLFLAGIVLSVAATSLWMTKKMKQFMKKNLDETHKNGQ